MTGIKGIDVKLIEKKVTGEDPFGAPVTKDEEITVKNVLVTPAAASDVIDTVNLTGKTASYMLCIPKGDTHNWINTEVIFYGQRWRTIGIPKEYIESMVPGKWNKQIMVERYE